MAAESGLESPGLSEAAAPAEAVARAPAEAAEPAAAPPGLEPHRYLRERLDLVEAALRQDPHSFGFFQAVRLIERLRPERAQVGGYADPAAEAIRFGVPPALGFPASEIQALDWREDSPTTIKVNFLGATGPQGVLPHEYTLLVADRLRARDAALADFLDLFHHRLLSLFYRAWRKYRFAAVREEQGTDAVGEHVLDLLGLGLPGTRPKLPFPLEALISRAGLLAPQPRGAVALQQLLEDFFEVPVAVEQFVGGWFPLASPDRCTIADDAEDPASQLGRGAVAGDEVWDQQAKVRIRLGPLDRGTYDAFLPGGTAHRSLASLVRLFSHDQYEFEVQLVLAADDIPGVRLADEGELPRLGWSTWIRSQPRERQADETILTLQSGAVS